MKKLKKWELECAALWDTFKDLYLSDGDKFDKKNLEKLLSIRALDVKAQRKVYGRKV